VLSQLLYTVPEADGQAGKVGGAERRRLYTCGAMHGDIDDVGVKLKDKFVFRRSTFGLQGL
jgi:hypothetical protein